MVNLSKQFCPLLKQDIYQCQDLEKKCLHLQVSSESHFLTIRCGPPWAISTAFVAVKFWATREKIVKFLYKNAFNNCRSLFVIRKIVSDTPVPFYVTAHWCHHDVMMSSLVTIIPATAPSILGLRADTNMAFVGGGLF